MASKASLSPLIHKQVPLKFDGASLNLSLSHALFSSHKVDPGSLFLLKTLAQQRDFTQVNRLLDWGCGVGTLGLAVKKRHPRTDVTMIDRQVLAAEFTELNAQNNGLEVTVLPGIGHFGIPGPFDLVLSTGRPRPVIQS
jgi:16S rRNA (guanine1207-N2)-methyltransferase